MAFTNTVCKETAINYQVVKETLNVITSSNETKHIRPNNRGLFPVSLTDSAVYDFSYILRYVHAMFFNFRTNIASADLTTNLIKHTSVRSYLNLALYIFWNIMSAWRNNLPEYFNMKSSVKIRHHTWVSILSYNYAIINLLTLFGTSAEEDISTTTTCGLICYSTRNYSYTLPFIPLREAIVNVLNALNTACSSHYF